MVTGVPPPAWMVSPLIAALLGEASTVTSQAISEASGRARGPLTELAPNTVHDALYVSAFGGFLVVQQAAQRMLPRGHGAILLTGATASVKGFPHSAAFAMGKFALRGLAQSAARELAPKGIHVAHFIIDGGVRSAQRPDPQDRPDSTLDPDAIAQSYLDVLCQHHSAWSWEEKDQAVRSGLNVHVGPIAEMRSESRCRSSFRLNGRPASR